MVNGNGQRRVTSQTHLASVAKIKQFVLILIDSHHVFDTKSLQQSCPCSRFTRHCAQCLSLSRCMVRKQGSLDIMRSAYRCHAVWLENIMFYLGEHLTVEDLNDDYAFFNFDIGENCHIILCQKSIVHTVTPCQGLIQNNVESN